MTHPTQTGLAKLGHHFPSLEKFIKPFIGLLKKQCHFDRQVTATINGYHYDLNLDDYIQQQMYYFGCFDKKGVRLITSLCKAIDCRTALNIGANIGNHAVHL